MLIDDPDEADVDKPEDEDEEESKNLFTVKLPHIPSFPKQT